MATQGNIIFFIRLKLSELILDLLQYKHVLDREAPDVDRFKKAFLKNQNFAPRNQNFDAISHVSISKLAF